MSVQIERCGHPRTDPLIAARDGAIASARARVLQRLRVPDTGQRFVLFAPAPAPSSPVAPTSGLDLAAVRASLAARFGGSWEVLIRTDRRDQRESDALLAGLPAFCRNVSPHPDLYELLLVADAAITDRGEWMADYLLTRRPAFLHITTTAPGRPRDLPLDVTTSTRELTESIARFDAEVHRGRVSSWLDAGGVIADGSAAVRAADTILRVAAG